MPFQPSSNKRPTIDYSCYKPVSVIASFKPNGDFIPLYFLAMLQDESEETYKVSVKYFKELCTMKSFCCVYEQNGRMQEVF